LRETGGLDRPEYERLNIDKLLQPLMEAEADQYGALLGGVMENQAEPLIRKIIGSKLQVSSTAGFSASELNDAEDLIGETILRLIQHLNQMHRDPAVYGIKAFHDFVAKVAFNVYNHYLREKYPQRHRLKKRIYYLIKTRPEFAAWKHKYEKLVGFAAWRNTRSRPGGNQKLQDLLKDHDGFVTFKLKGVSPRNIPLDELLTRLFEWIDCPLAIDSLVNVVANLLGVKDQQSADWQQSTHSSRRKAATGEQVVFVPDEAISAIESRGHLRLVWEEIKKLPKRQRQALLLSLKDENGSGLIQTWSAGGIATVSQIAAILEMTSDELERIWRQLPLKDGEIAQLLGVTSKNVVNIRKAARERLKRRMKARSAFQKKSNEGTR